MTVFYQNIQSLCQEHSTTPSAVCKALKLSTSMVTRWRDGTIPNGATLQKIANYFGVSVDYLISSPDDRLPLYSERSALPSMLRSDASLDYGDDFRESRANVSFMSENNVCLVPVLESVSAGLGTIAIDDVVDYQPIYFNHPSEAHEHICLKVKGDSMYPKIEDGDVILIHKQDSVDSGTLAVILLDGEEGLVKRIEYGEDWIELHSINPMYKAMRFDGPDTLRIRIVGLVKKIIKSV